jgi:hypothetical protein
MVVNYGETKEISIVSVVLIIPVYIIVEEAD